MHMIKTSLDGFRVTYGKERNGPYSARIYDSSTESYFTPIKYVKGCETKEEVLLRIGFEICDLIKNEVSPFETYEGKTRVISYDRLMGDKEEKK